MTGVEEEEEKGAEPWINDISGLIASLSSSWRELVVTEGGN